MYYLYLDESGDAGDYLNDKLEIISGSSRFFTLAGIIVEDTKITNFKNVYDSIMLKYFKGITLPANFKLHYHELRQTDPKIYPYDQLRDPERWSIPEEIFSIIRSEECWLLSVTIDLERHCRKYEWPVDARAYSLLVILERFQYFLEEKNSTGKAIYEEYNAKLRKRTELELRKLQKYTKFPQFTDLGNIQGKVERGQPSVEIILQFADFFTYLPWIRKTTNYSATSKWNSVMHKYYNLDGVWNKRGYVEI